MKITTPIRYHVVKISIEVLVAFQLNKNMW